MVSLDGFFAGPRGEFDWPLVDEGFNQFAIDQLDAVDTLLFGRVTYEGMASYWPTAATSPSGTLKSDIGVEFAVPTAAWQGHGDFRQRRPGIDLDKSWSDRRISPLRQSDRPW